MRGSDRRPPPVNVPYSGDAVLTALVHSDLLKFLIEGGGAVAGGSAMGGPSLSM
jgi:hypothetical protein